MTAYRRTSGTVTRSQLRVRVGGSTMGAGRRLRTPFVDPAPTPDGSTVYSPEPLGAGGWVTGMSISPDGLTRLARTDTLGAWRWDEDADHWEQCVTLGALPGDGDDLDSGEGVNAIAAANSLSFMAYRDRVYRTTDRGTTWTLVLDGPTTAPNMGNQRWWNTRMAFDPNDAAVLIYGTLNAGLYYTLNGGTSWTQVPPSSLPIGLDGAATPGKQTFGIVCVAIDPAGTWYAAPYGSGVYRSTNQGATWAKISNDSNFVAVAGMQAGPNGDLMVAAHTSTTTLNGSTSVLYRYRAGTWTQMTGLVGQGTRQWRTVAYDPHTPGRVLIQGDGGYNRMSVDYGDTWASASHSMYSDDDIPWLAAANGFGADFFFVTIGGLQFDPAVPGRVWMSEGIGVWYADLNPSPSALIPWHAQSRGIEQLVTNDVLCPPGGRPVVSSWDRAIFLVGETSSPPVLSIAPVGTTPLRYPASLDATLVAAYPVDLTYAWSVVSKPAASSGGTFFDSTARSTAFTPDVAGDYVLRLTATNSIGTTTADVTLTAAGQLTGLVLPGTSGNYLSTPDAPDLNISDDLTLIAKLSLADWSPTTRTTIIGKHGTTSKSYRLAVDATGFHISLETNATGSTGFHSSTNIPVTFPGGSVHWVRLVYSRSAQTAVVSTSADGVTWTLHKSIGTAFSMGSLTALAPSTAPVTVGFSASAPGVYAAGNVYLAQVYDGATLVADFDASHVTPNGARVPTSYSDSAGKLWTVQGNDWAWVS